jgi:hypothetical protein
MLRRTFMLMALVAVIVGCEADPHPPGPVPYQERLPPYVQPTHADTVAAAAASEAARLAHQGIYRVKIGECYYVIAYAHVYGGNSVSIVHASDCPNHWCSGGAPCPRRTTP